MDKKDDHSDLFEDNFKELKKWVDIKSPKYGTLFVIRERCHGRLGTALKVLEPLKRKIVIIVLTFFFFASLSLVDITVEFLSLCYKYMHVS